MLTVEFCNIGQLIKDFKHVYLVLLNAAIFRRKHSYKIRHTALIWAINMLELE